MRVLSFFLGLVIMCSVVAYPRFIAEDMQSVPHGWLVVLLLGMSSCFVYGVGFRPNNSILQLFFSPICGWSLVLIGGFMLLYSGPFHYLFLG
ncbi:MAG: cyd operon YbgE family protein [Burkholderiaceae bacterium]|nr:cyd operon YbgE family protein [Burkholderiaceae bacterium]